MYSCYCLIPFFSLIIRLIHSCFDMSVCVCVFRYLLLFFFPYMYLCDYLFIFLLLFLLLFDSQRKTYLFFILSVWRCSSCRRCMCSLIVGLLFFFYITSSSLLFVLQQELDLHVISLTAIEHGQLFNNRAKYLRCRSFR